MTMDVTSEQCVHIDLLILTETHTHVKMLITGIRRRGCENSLSYIPTFYVNLTLS